MKTKFYHPVLFISLLFSFNLLGQENTPAEYNLECGTTLLEDSKPNVQRQLDERWQTERDYYLDVVHTVHSSTSRDFSNIRMIPVQLHIIRTTAGTGGVDPVEYEKALALANEFFMKGGIHLYQCSAINYIDDDTYYDYNKTQKTALDADYAVSNVLNIYTANTVTSGTSSICGHAEFPGGLDFAMLSSSCALNGSTFAHEVGHYLNVYHTHQGGDELVSGVNCAISGDLLCDTPADPRLSGSTNLNDSGCVYYGTETDATGASYNPSTSNLMSYSAKSCRFEFTDEQYARMLACIDSDRTYLTCAASLNSAFYSIPDYGNCDNTMQAEFANVSTGSVTSYAWNFGDGGTSTDASPTHTYTTAGSYNVQLTVGDGTSNDVEMKNYEIAVGAVAMPYTQDFETGESALGQFRQNDTYKNYVEVNATAGNGSTNGLALYGYGVGPNTSSPYFRTPSSGNAFDEMWNPFFKSNAYLCVNGLSYSGISLDFDLKQMYNYNVNYSNFRVTINGVEIAMYQANGTETWSTKSLDLSAYDETVFTIGFEGTHKYGMSDNATFIDNIAISGAVVLPVELTSFEAKSNEKQQVDLNWETASQKNFSHFEVEHRAGNTPFAKFAVVETREANSQAFTAYQDTHENPINGMNYYRLKMVDLDGSFEYSDVKAVEIKKSSNTSPTFFPNPVQVGASLILDIDNLSNANLKIYQSNGQLVRDMILGAGSNRLNSEDFSSGIYFYVIKAENEVFNGRLVVID